VKESNKELIHEVRFCFHQPNNTTNVVGVSVVVCVGCGDDVGVNVVDGVGVSPPPFQPPPQPKGPPPSVTQPQGTPPSVTSMPKGLSGFEFSDTFDPFGEGPPPFQPPPQPKGPSPSVTPLDALNFPPLLQPPPSIPPLPTGPSDDVKEAMPTKKAAPHL